MQRQEDDALKNAKIGRYLIIISEYAEQMLTFSEYSWVMLTYFNGLKFDNA